MDARERYVTFGERQMQFPAFRRGSNSNYPSTSGRTAETILQANFYEKALFVKVDVATTVWLTQLLCPSRYASIRTLEELTLFLVARCIMRSVFSGSSEALQSSERSLLVERLDQVRLAQSPY